jgi:ABC-2 type transport system ATP-binding protein
LFPSAKVQTKIKKSSNFLLLSLKNRIQTKNLGLDEIYSYICHLKYKEMLRLENIVKSYDKYVAVNDVSFEIPAGKIFGMLGPNGAGKTSIIRIITTITRADYGQVWLDGKPLTESLAGQIGYMPEERGLYKKMKVGEQLLYLAQLKGMSYIHAKSEIMDWMTKFEIQDWWNKKIDELSKGMQQKVQFISTVLHRPKLLILDEPFTGLDPLNATLIQDEINQMHREGTTIIFSTHRMEQVEEICDSIVLINKGKNVLEGNVKDIKQQFKQNLFEFSFDGTLPGDLDNICKIQKNHRDNMVSVQLHEGVRSNDLLQKLISNDVQIMSFQEQLPSLNEIFIKTVEGK